MSWYKKAKFNTIDDLRDHWEKILGLGKYKPKNIVKKKEKKEYNGPCHSLDMHCDGGDDGY